MAVSGLIMLYPTWPWALLGMGHPQSLWATCCSASPSCHSGMVSPNVMYVQPVLRKAWGRKMAVVERKAKECLMPGSMVLTGSNLCSSAPLAVACPGLDSAQFFLQLACGNSFFHWQPFCPPGLLSMPGSLGSIASRWPTWGQLEHTEYVSILFWQYHTNT